MDAPRLTVFSTPLVSTWVLDETHRILFDAGDGAAALLEGRVHRVNRVCLTHAHRDHIAGLPQLLNLRAGQAFADGDAVRILHPDGSGSFHAMARFLSRLDPTTTGTTLWHAARPGDRFEIDSGRYVEAIASRHVPCPHPGKHRSLAWRIGRRVERLRPELRDRPQDEIDRERMERGRAAITATEDEAIFTVSGDTSPLTPAEIGESRFLLHECTFLDVDAERCSEAHDRGHEHSVLSDVLTVIENSTVEIAALYHISRRYTDEEIVRTIREACAARGIRARVCAALPGRVWRDLFAQPIWPGAAAA